jgi:hypothetical protein
MLVIFDLLIKWSIEISGGGKNRKRPHNKMDIGELWSPKVTVDSFPEMRRHVSMT